MNSTRREFLESSVGSSVGAIAAVTLFGGATLAEDRLPIEVVLSSPEDEGAHGALLDLIEMVWEFESFGPDEGGPGPKSLKLNVLS